MPTSAECDALYEAAPILDDEGPLMQDVCERYMLHRNEIEQASGGDDEFFRTGKMQAGSTGSAARTMWAAS